MVENNFKSGFALIELLVVVSIFMIVFVFSYQGLRDNRHLEEFRLATERLANDVKRVQTMVLSGVSDQDLGNISYGIFFDTAEPQEYLIFKDTNINQLYDDGTDTIMETTFLPPDISLSEVSTANQLTIIFLPPKPTMYINGGEIIETGWAKLTRSNLSGKAGLVNIYRISGRITAELINL